MKKLLLIAISIFCLSECFAQDEVISAITDDNYNFKVVDGDVVWQFVYETDKTTNEVLDYFRSSNLFKVTSTDSLSIIGSVERQSINYKKFGFKTMLIAIYINSPASYNIEINIKDEKYRVTIKDVTFASTTDFSMYGVSTNSNSQYSLTEMSYNHKRSKFKAAFFGQNAAQPLATFWHDMFLIKSVPDTSDDW